MKKLNNPDETVKQQEKAIKEIVKRYGDTIDLRKSPYLIAEIIREYATLFPNGNTNQSEPVPGSHGTPPPPPPSPDGMRDPRDQYTQINAQLVQLTRKISQMEQQLKLKGMM
ncbi:hypothetical protein DWB84_11685 [Saccharophagus sp. K07]|jgi:hypothetical protein|uniref:hypothetical protein n=1 Tax=Saccharophagus sp. K07 TaxID=2283636 RepID=UPI0016524D66|nr:hypothetical protein [Saccharophagus sp. K07]MBC6906121.1 hypothetical protein [Saccharophagus sp. K07]